MVGYLISENTSKKKIQNLQYGKNMMIMNTIQGKHIRSTNARCGKLKLKQLPIMTMCLDKQLVNPISILYEQGTKEVVHLYLRFIDTE